MDRFISPKAICARVKEELKSYFNTNSLDDLMFPIWIKECIDKMIYTYLPLEPVVLDVCDYKAELPCDFKAVREVWATTTYHKGPVNLSGSFYYQTDCRIEPAPPNTSCSSCVPGYQCFPPSQTPVPVGVPSLCDVPDEYVVTHKVNREYVFSFKVTTLLKPGNFRTNSNLVEDCPNRYSSCMDTFDIIGNHIKTSFSHGTLYMVYYSDQVYTEDGYPEIPDNDPFQKYVYYHLRRMCYQVLYDQATAEDEYQIIKDKKSTADREDSDAYINARNYAIAPTVYGIQQAIIRSYNRHNRFIVR